MESWNERRSEESQTRRREGEERGGKAGERLDEVRRGECKEVKGR